MTLDSTHLYCSENGTVAHPENFWAAEGLSALSTHACIIWAPSLCFLLAGPAIKYVSLQGIAKKLLECLGVTEMVANVRQFYRLGMPTVMAVGNRVVKASLAIIGLLVVANQLLSHVIPYTNKWITDALSARDGSHAMLLFAASMLQVLSNVCYSVQNCIWTYIGWQINTKLSLLGFAQVHKLSVRWHYAQQTGSIPGQVSRGASS
ncbi:HMT-1 protein, partial [Aphelenchoides avenae]